MMRKFSEYKAVMTKMPASKCNMPILTLSHAVTTPAIIPAIIPNRHAIQGLKPEMMDIAATAPPKGKLPSAVKSGKSNMRNDMSTPSAMMAYINPLSNAPKKAINDIFAPKNTPLMWAAYFTTVLVLSKIDCGVITFVFLIFFLPVVVCFW